MDWLPCPLGPLGSPFVPVVSFDLGSVSFPEEQWSKDLLHTSEIPVLAYHVGRISLPRDVVEADDSSCDGIPSAVVRQGIVAFVELGMWGRRSVDHRFVVSKHHGSSLDRHT